MTPTTDEALRTIALVIITSATEDAAEWEDFPGIGEHDWQAVVDHVGSIVGSMRPTHQQVREAYLLLAGRADES